MKRIALMMWIAVVTAMTLLAGCGAGGGGTSVSVSDVGNVEGTVTDTISGAVVLGATVQVGDKSATTNSSGVYSVTDLPVGSRTITATKTNYQNYTGTVTVTKGMTVTQNIQMTLTGGGGSGSLDSTFGTGGKVTTAIGSFDDYAQALGIQSDGKIVAAGSSTPGGNIEFALVRYNTDGTRDSTFGTGGKVTTAIGSFSSYATALAIQSDGKIVATGYSDSYSGNSTDYDFAIVRYITSATKYLNLMQHKQSLGV